VEFTSLRHEQHNLEKFSRTIYVVIKDVGKKEKEQ